MITIDILELGVMTRDERWAESTGSVQLFIGSTQVDVPSIYSSWSPPGRGGYASFHVTDLAISIDPADDVPFEIGISSDDKWGIREAILTGTYIPEGGGPRFGCAMAIGRPTFDDDSQVDVWLSQDPSEGPSRIPLSRFRQAEPNTLIREMAVSLLTDRSYARTTGPIELLLYSKVGNIPVVVYQTTLSRVGRQDPGSGRYFLRIPLPFDGIQSSDLESMVLINRSDDAWGLVGAQVFAWGIGEKGEAIGGLISSRSTTATLSQDISDKFPDPATGLYYLYGWGTPNDHVVIPFRDVPTALPSS